MSVKVINLKKVFGEQVAVDSINFEIGEGEIVGFLGPNGAGKSTTMKMLTGFLPPTSGESWVAGFNVAKHPLEVKQNIGYLPEHNPLYLDVYVKEYLLFCAGIFKLKNKEARVKEIIEKVGLTPEYKKKIGQLSKGYRQRVGLAQALIHDPKVLILDEPTSGLDPNQIVDIRNVIKEFGKDKTVILSTHIMQEALALCSKVMIINHGVIVANDKVENLQNTAKTKTIIVLQLSKEIDLIHLEAVPGVLHVKRIAAHKYELECATDLREQLFFAVAQSGTAILNMQLEQQSLEEIFKVLTNPNFKK
ncbi:MAG: gliding motility-associated ABC transporter ATP-binding subunit GldA [Bacteroidetes bacterium]|nr:gliding motility-associated ABC transporter ATP-binding subunit GldA [Bacteroidota bacterium]